MRRKHLVELEDLSICPAVLRDGATSYLRFIADKSGHAVLLAEKLGDAMQISGERTILDLCSGGGGPTSLLVPALAERFPELRVLLSDLYPNGAALGRISAESGGRVDWVREPVDATRVSPQHVGLRVMMNAFHHLTPTLARGVLADAVRNRRPIAVFELLSRETLPLFGVLCSPLAVMLAVPFLRPFDWRWPLLTYVIPLLPFLAIFDGVVSWLRIYSVPELLELTRSLDAPGWRWDIGEVQLGYAPVHATYLLGYPPEA